MATLSSEDLSFVFNYTKFEYGWIHYQCSFCWQGQSVINDAVLKRYNDYWNDRPVGVFIACEYETDGLLPLLKQVLDSNEADYWEATDPDIEVAIYPNRFFPFLKSHWQLIHQSEERKQELTEKEKLKAEKGNLPNDLFTIMFRIDAYNFKDADAYYGAGLILHMLVTRQELEGFVAQLETEWQEIQARYPDKDMSSEN